MGTEEDFVHVSCEAFQKLVATKPLLTSVRWEAVISRSVRLKESIEYSVDIEGDSGERLMTVYRRVVHFGNREWNRAGGAAFVQAAREQEVVSADFGKFIVGREGD